MAFRNDFRQLKDLLVSWKLPELYEYFKDQDINIEELELMKPHHVAELFANHRMGLRIRFEHKLEVWRRDLNKPLFSGPTKYVYGSTVITQKCAQQDRCTNTDFALKVDTTANESAPVLSIGAATSQAQTSPTTASMQILPTSSSIEYPLLTQSEPPLNDAPNYEPVTILADPTTPITAEACYDECSDQPPFHGNDLSTLSQILQESGTRGAELVNYYQQHKEFSANTRTLLIHLIVHFFEKHDYHLSLNTSHQLEREILKMFPNERLENYRTEKRGKIYVKFCNMKRYKKDRGLDGKRKMSGAGKWSKSPVSASGGSKEVSFAFGNNESDEVDDEDYSMRCETSWNEPQISMVEIKTESEEDN